MNERFNSEFDIKIANTENERKKLSHLTSYAFLPSPADLTQSQKGFESIKDAFIQSVYPKNSDSPIATASCIPMTQNVRGKIFKMGGIEAVATQPEFRNQGIIRQLMINIFKHAKETGEVFSTLFPFKESFYAKFDYISFPQTKIATIPMHKLSTVKNYKVTGIVKHYYLEKVFDEYYDFTVEMQSLIHGMSTKTKETTSFINVTRPSYVAFAYLNDKITGCMVYTTKGHSEPLDVKYFYYRDSNAKYLLLQFIASHIDQFSEVWLPIRPNEVPELWLNDLNLRISTRSWSSMGMGRIINVESLQGMTVGNGSITAKIIDKNCNWNNGIFTFKEVNNCLEVIKISNNEVKPVCSLTIAGLSALVYGGYELGVFPFKNWILDYDAGSNCFQKLKDLFQDVLPFMHEHF